MTKKPDIEGKPLILAATIYRDYGQAIVKMIDRLAKDTKRELKRVFEETATDSAMDASVTSQARIVINALLSKWEPLFNAKATKATERMINQVDRNSAATLGMSLKEMSEHITLSRVGLTTPDIQEIMKASTQEAANLIKTIPQEYLADVQGAVMRSITSGNGLQDLIPFMNDKYKQNLRKARNVARDQTRKAYNALNTGRMKKMGIKQFVWIHSGGGKEPRKLHQELNGKVCDYDDPPYIGDMYGQKVYGLPGELPNCHPGESKFTLTNGCHKLYRRGYCGELITLITDSGETLKATPNHPILTGRGWLPINEIKMGDYVISAGKHGRDGSKAEHDNLHPGIGDVFDSLLSVVGTSRKVAGGSALEFHGDVSDGEIDVIDIDSLLPSEWDVEFCQKFGEFIFSWANKHGWASGFLEDGSFDKRIMGMFESSDGIMRGADSLFALFGSHSAHADDIRLRLVSDFTSSLNQSTPNYAARYIELLSHFEFAHSGNVGGNYFGIGNLFALCCRLLEARNLESPSAESLGEIIRIASKDSTDINQIVIRGKHEFSAIKQVIYEEFSGHVYNLETSKNWYLSNGIITHNCGCSQKPVINFEDMQ